MLNFVAKVAIQIGMMAANMALTMTRKMEGPRLDDTKFTSGDYGSPLALVWGKRRLQVPIFWAEDLKEIKRQRKTKGGKYNEYTYYGTWAVALAGHEIDAVTRIWFDTHLVYDMTGAGPVTPFDFSSEGGDKSGTAGIGGFSPASNIAIYYGTETQEQDPRILATTEAKHGEGSCPAYRGTAYIVFKDVPLEKLGNRIPQVSVEFVSQGSSLWPTERIALAHSADFWNFSPDHSVLIANTALEFSLIDEAARTVIANADFSPSQLSGVAYETALTDDGTIYGHTAFVANFMTFEVSGAGTSVGSSSYGTTWALASGFYLDGAQWWGAYGAYNHYVFNGAEVYTPDTSWGGANFFSCGFLTDADGDVWLVGAVRRASAYDHLLLVNLSTGTWWETTMPGGVSSAEYVQGGYHYVDATHDHFVIWWNGTLYALDPADGTVLYSQAVTIAPEFRCLSLVSSTIWCGLSEVSLADLTVVRSLPMTTWGLSGGDQRTVYDARTHALWVEGGDGASLRVLYLDRVTGGNVTLGEIAADIAEQVGVVDSDFSALDQVIPGWSATQGPASNMLEPLLDAYDSDVRPHEFTLQGIKRTGTSLGTILTERFVGQPRYSVKVRQAAELPRAITINFADLNGDQQPNNVRADRPLDATGARGEKSLDLSTLAIAPDDARDLADRYFRRIWNSRKEVSNGLTAQYLALEPGDCETLDLDGERAIYQLVKLTVKADDSLATEWRYDAPSLALISGATGAGFDGRDPDTVVVAVLTKGFILDTPLLTDRDSTANPLLYLAAAPYASGAWPGATIYQAIDGEYSDELASVPSTSPATWGYANAALADANPNLWDRASTLNVTLQVGSLTGTTEALIDANPTANLALIGDELVNFTTATLETDGSYTLSGFKRGRRGTEWATGTHASRDVFLLLNTVSAVTLGLSDVSTDMSFKAITAGRTTGFPIGLTPFTGASLKPYAPCHLSAVKDSGTGDWTLSWVRRTRVGGAWTGGAAIPLSEASEEYHLTVGDGVSSDTKTVTSATSYVWDVATQTADTGAEVMAGDLVWGIAQVSDAVGDGFLAEATA